MNPTLKPHLIGLDWGTSSLRAYLMADGGHVVESRAKPWGIQQVPNGDYVGALSAMIADWPQGLPIMASGMIGSRGGWREVPYVPCPAEPSKLASGLLRIDSPNGAVHLVPGVIQQGALPDVMRGEETQILGALADHPQLAKFSLVVLPGTHSKWVRIRDGLIESFATHMTGELFSSLRDHTILGRPARDVAQQSSEAVFIRGIQTAKLAGAEGLSARLFSTRSLFLTGQLPAEHTLDYLSGLLIGEEIRSALATCDSASMPPIILIGDSVLTARYQLSLAQFSLPRSIILQDTAPKGLWLIARAHQLI
jgi:2-dehydro-3-deoxygalactonokinase